MVYYLYLSLPNVNYKQKLIVNKNIQILRAISK